MALLDKIFGKPNLSPVEQQRKNRLAQPNRITQDFQASKNQASPYGSLPKANNKPMGPFVQQGPTKPTAPAGFNYSQTKPAATPSTVNTAAVAPPPPAPTSNMSAPAGSDLAARVAAMSKQAEGPAKPTVDAPTPTAPPPLSGPNVSPAGAGINAANLRSLAERNLAQYRESVLRAMSPGQDERRLADELAQFQGDARMGIAGLEGQGRGIPLGLVRGQQAKLGEQAGIQEQTLLGRLNAAQQARQGDLLAAQTQLGFEEADIAREEARANAQAAGLKPIEVGGNLVALNPETGAYEVVYQAPSEADRPVVLSEGQRIVDPTTGREIAYAPKERAPITVSAGQTILDPNTGEVLFRAADKPEALPSSIQEYMFAVSEGYGGDYNSFKNQTASSSAESRKIDAIAQSGLQALDDIEGYITSVPNAVIALDRVSPAGRQYQAARANLIDLIARLRTGAAITESEAKRFEGLLPSSFDTDETARFKLNQLRQNFSDVMSKQAAEGGGDDVDQFLDSFSEDPGTSVNGPIVSVKLGGGQARVSSSIADRLKAADEEFFRATGQHIVVNEGHRSRERQTELYQRYKTGQGGRAAPPGQSFHETGSAVDIRNWEAAAPYLRKYGFRNDLADDRNHFSIGEFA